ncbi:MAG: hypothetical protein WCR52_12210 [Bacteroidota bacterium]
MSWSTVFSQSRPCKTPICGQLKVEAIRLYPNLKTDCTNLTANVCGGGDASYQMYFDVYLKFVNGGADAFNLDYSHLDVKVTLKQLSTNQRSYIDIGATKSCFSNSSTGSKWLNYSNTTDGNRVAFTATDQSVDISFLNTNTSDPCGSTTNNGGIIGSTKIEFEDNTPSNAATCATGVCYYVKLFTVVVNAYPGENVALDLDPDHTKYTPYNGSLSCQNVNSPAISKENTSTNLAYNGFANGNTISSPSTNTGTQNAFVELQMTGPVQSNGKQEFTLKLANTNSTDNITVNHVDFYVKVSRRNNTELLSFTGNMPLSVVDKGQDPSNSGYRYYLLHYVINNLGTINSGTTTNVGVIQIPNPTLTTINWNAILTTSMQVGRINTKKTKNGNDSNACTDLKSNVNSTYDLTTQFQPCTDAGILFDVVKVPSTSCVNDFVYNAGIRALSGNETRNITRLEFELVFDMDSDVSISSADDTNLGINCNGLGCAGASCYTISGNTFHYGFCGTTATVQTVLINPFKYVKINFAHTGNGCVRSFKITKLLIQYTDSAPCVLPILPTINPNTQSVDLSSCGPILSGNILTETNKGLEDATITAGAPQGSCATPSSCCASSCTGTCVPTTELTNTSGLYGFCSLCACPTYLLTPYKNDNPLNGVSTYDLVLISKHILGIEPLGSPYKMIAADANKSRSITTFDIVELRKLILGIYTALPSNTSWRFVDKNHSFPNQSNPFDDPEFPEKIDCADPTQLKPFNFVAIKVGDVNDTAVPNSMKPADRPVTTISWTSTAIKSSEILSVPVVYTGSESIEALQLGLRFDPAQYKLIGTAPGDLSSYNAANFGLTSADKGEIRTLWFPFQNPDERIKPGTILFYLNFKVLKGGADATLNLALDNDLLSNTAWQQDGREFSIAAAPPSERVAADNQKVENVLQVNVQPNPSSGAVSFIINAPQAMKARIVLFSASGARVLLHDVALLEGEQRVALSEVLNLPAGIYTWKVYGKGTEVQGQLVKN